MVDDPFRDGPALVRFALVAVQDNGVRSLVGTLAGRLKAAGVVQVRQPSRTCGALRSPRGHHRRVEHCNHILGWVYLVRGAFDLAEHYYQRALALNPNSPLNVQGIAEWLAYVGRADEAMKWFRQAKLVDPLYNPSWWWRMEGAAHFSARKYDEAIAAFSRSPI